ncbi:acid protease [Aureobasidium sp. EXF-10728]|nr:acid protease [Aureobasidium sp. EXF-10728]
MVTSKLASLNPTVVVFLLATTVAKVSCSVQPLVISPILRDGLDGTWSSFNLSVGVPAQNVRVLPSWQSFQTLVVGPEGCSMYSNYNDCVNSRGQVFNLSQSSDWNNIGIFEFQTEKALGFPGNAYYGYDKIVLDDANHTTVEGSTVGAFAVSDFWLGSLGLNPKPSNWSETSHGLSLMTKLKGQSSIPSISFGYTAGAPYRFSGVAGSLTLGGYDQSRFEANNVEFDFASDPTKDTIVAIQAINTQARNSSASVELLPAPIYASIDSTVSQIWLPLDACQAFEREFGLTWDSTYNLYIVNSTLHASLLARNAYVNFTIGTTASGLQTTTISLPYAAFDMTAQSPYQGLADRSSYFPLRRAANSTQYTLGRTFMQEAYITVDYERAKFNVSQCVWPQNVGDTTEIIIIEPAPSSENSGYSGASSGSNALSTSGKSSKAAGLSGGAIGGIVAGSVLGVATLIGLATWFIRRDRRKKTRSAKEETGDESSPSRDSISRTTIGIGEKGTTVFPKAELEGSTVLDDPKPPLRPESSLASPTTLGYGGSTWSSTQTDSVSPGLASPGAASEAGGLEIYEMPGDMPELAQADGRTITEKEMMRRREEVYNGVDRSNPATPTIAGPVDRRSVQPEEVVLLDEGRDGEGSSRPNSRFSFE